MKSRIEIEKRLAETNDAFVIEVLRWVLESPDCLLCDHPKKREYELALKSGELTPTYLEEMHGWPEGTCDEHMDSHVQYDAEEAQHMEKMRKESITTLDMAEGIVERLLSWLDELEEQRQGGALTSEWIHDATKLAGQANASLKLVGQLKKEIGVDSQLLLADAKLNSVMGALVHVLGPHPELLDSVELHLAKLKAPSSVIDAEFEVIE
tara:strand:+ start:368 stop:994 length:627 start_codon:yes stop_codon:yes gene_type:complete